MPNRLWQAGNTAGGKKHPGDTSWKPGELATASWGHYAVPTDVFLPDDPAHSLSYSQSGSPAWVSFDAANINFRPFAASVSSLYANKTYPITLTATESVSNTTDSLSFTLRVTSTTNNPPAYTAPTGGYGAQYGAAEGTHFTTGGSDVAITSGDADISGYRVVQPSDMATNYFDIDTAGYLHVNEPGGLSLPEGTYTMKLEAYDNQTAQAQTVIPVTITVYPGASMVTTAEPIIIFSGGETA